MSQALDVAEAAVAFLLGEEPTNQERDVARLLTSLIGRWHAYSHEYDDVLNRGRLVGRIPALLETALRYKDDGERAKWLMLKGKVRQ